MTIMQQIIFIMSIYNIYDTKVYSNSKNLTVCIIYTQVTKVLSMKMIILFQVTCFDMDATLSGITQQRTFEIQFQPYDINKRCVAFNDSEAVAFINYKDSGTIKNITTNFNYLANQNITVYFLNVTENAFNAIQKLSRVSYNIIIDEMYEFSGSFSAIKNTQANISNCWNTMTLEYKRTGPDAYISLKAIPYFCSIYNPQVFFEFRINGIWNIIEIKPNSSSIDGFKFPYNHLSTKFYQVYKVTLNNSQQIIFDYFFNEFSINRMLEIRMKMEYQKPGVHIKNQIISQVSTFATIENKCLGKVNFTTTAGNLQLSNVGSLMECEKCVPKGESVVARSIFQNQQFENKEPLLSFSHRQSITYYYKNDSVLFLPNGQQQFLFFSVLDKYDQVIHEEAYQLNVTISCWHNVIYMVNPKESCLVIFPIKTGRCDRLYSIGQYTFIEQSIQYTSDTISRTTFQYFMAFIQYQNTNFAKICFSQNKTIPNSTFQQIDGTFQKKQKQYLKDRLLANATLTFIRNDHEYQLLQNITLTDCNKLIYIVIGIFSGVLILVILTVFIAVKNQ